MSNTNLRTAGASSVEIVVGLFLAFCCSGAQAAAPVLFDIQGLLLTLLFWYGVAIAMGIGILFLKSETAKSLAALGLIAYLLTPPLIYVVSDEIKKKGNEESDRQFREAQKDIAYTLADYCKGRRQQVHKIAGDAKDATVAMRFEKGFTGSPPHFGGWSLAETLRNDPSSCARLRIKFIEEAFPPSSIASGSKVREYRRYDICERSGYETIASVDARYELVLGSTSERKPYPNTSLSDTWMSFSSVQIIDRKNGTVLAEDALYFNRYEPSGMASCPSGLPLIKELLEKVFGA